MQPLCAEGGRGMRREYFYSGLAVIQVGYFVLADFKPPKRAIPHNFEFNLLFNTQVG